MTAALLLTAGLAWQVAMPPQQPVYNPPSPSAKAVYWAGAVADLATTAYALEHRPTLREANPLLRPFDGNTATITAVGGGLKYLVYRMTRRMQHRNRWLYAGGALYGAAAASNINQINKAAK